MEAMIEAGLDDAVVLRARPPRWPALGERAARGLLDQHMAAGFDGAERDRGKLVVRGRDDDGVDVGLDRFAPVGDGARLGLLRKLSRAREIAIADDHDLVRGRRRGSALSPDQAASDDREPHHFLSHGSPRSAGTMRRSV